MKTIAFAFTICFILTLAVSGQVENSRDYKRPSVDGVTEDYQYVEIVRDPWVKLGRTFGKAAQDVFYRNLVSKRDGVEAWLKFVPRNGKPMYPATKYTKAVTYMLQFVSIDCSDKRMSVESVVLYDKSDDIVSVPFSGMMRTYRDPVVPGSIGEIAWRELCR